MQAREEGLELEDPEIFRELVLKYNERVDIFADSEDSDYPDYTPNIPVKEHQRKIGRNEPCPCGSGKKYKKCCGRVGLN
jgi:preprotein translocase subunit SecA